MGVKIGDALLIMGRPLGWSIVIASRFNPDVYITAEDNSTAFHKAYLRQWENRKVAYVLPMPDKKLLYFAMDL